MPRSRPALAPVLDLPLVFAIGLLGSAHCVGMCGGFVVALGHAQRGGPSIHIRQSLYFLGKTATYALFGAAAGAAGAAVGLALSGFQGLVSLGLGLVLVVVGLSLCGVLHRLGFAERIAGRFAGRFAGARVLGEAVRRLVARGTAGATFGLGMLNGLLPCALVYGLLARAAAAGSPLGGAAVMAVFGLGTIPALYLTGLFGNLVPPTRRLWLSRLGGVLIVALGVLTMARGATAFGLTDGHAAHGSEQQILCLPTPDAEP
ncbi:MAG: sulfite exporter TauE/SafE family protein [Rhodothermales bacterium]